jgi:hypothetical protein
MIPALVPIVEGKSEVEGLRGLLNRIVYEVLNETGVQIATPFLVKRYLVVKDGRLESAIDAAIRDRQEKGVEVGAILVLLDADEDCPVEVAKRLNERARSATKFPISVVLADRAIESWFLGAKESLRGVCGIARDAIAPENAECLPNPKRRLSNNISGGRYRERRDLPTLAERIDIRLCGDRCRSFRKFVKEVRALIAKMNPP